jgi:hypothetical protein
MSKKKKQKATKKVFKKHKNSNNTPISNKKPYQDDFLGKSIDLAPSAFEVFSELKEKGGNQIILRPEQSAVLKSKKSLNESELIDKKETNMEEVIESLSIGMDGKKEKIEQLFEKINEEKAEFDAKIKTTEKIFTKKDNNSMMFDRIYTKEFSKNTKPKTFLGSIIDVLTSEIVWNSIAIAMILGVFLFYFQGLQPVILQNYVTSGQKQVNKVADKYSTQISGYFTDQTKISESYTYTPSQLCSNMKLYETGAKDVDDINRLQVSLFTDQKLKKLPNFQSFYDSQIQDEYQRYFLKYQTKIDKYNQPTKDLKDHVRFLSYRNNWIKSCILVEKSQDSIAAINQACTDLNTFTIQLLAEGKPTFWSEVEKPVGSILTSCSTVNEGTKKEFVKNFFITFDEFMFYQPDFTALNQQLTGANQEFLAVDTQRMRQFMKNLQKDREDFFNSWYLMGFEF